MCVAVSHQRGQGLYSGGACRRRLNSRPPVYPSSYQRLRWSGTLRRGRPKAASFHPAWMAPARSAWVGASRRRRSRGPRSSALLTTFAASSPTGGAPGSGPSRQTMRATSSCGGGRVELLPRARGRLAVSRHSKRLLLRRREPIRCVDVESVGRDQRDLKVAARHCECFSTSTARCWRTRPRTSARRSRPANLYGEPFCSCVPAIQAQAGAVRRAWPRPARAAAR